MIAVSIYVVKRKKRKIKSNNKENPNRHKYLPKLYKISIIGVIVITSIIIGNQIPSTTQTEPTKFNGVTISDSDISQNGGGGIIDNGVPLKIIKSKINNNTGNGLEANNVPSLNINETQINNNTKNGLVVNNQTITK